MKLNGNIIKKAHFIGIGGIGMSGLARWFMKEGIDVSGSDASKTILTEQLHEEGAKLFYGHAASQVPSDADCVIYTRAIGENNLEYKKAQELGKILLTYHQVLAQKLQGMFTIVVAGTHGKTTTTAMIGKLLHDSGFSPTIVCGGIMADFKSNIVIGDKPYAVVEGCEYKRSFLNLIPNILVITNIELDHTDYYKDLADLQSAFISLREKIPQGGYIICDTDSKEVRPVVRTAPQAHVLDYTDYSVDKLDLKLPGDYNKKNAQAAGMAGRTLKISEEEIKKSLESFSGTERRFEYKGKAPNGALLYDDYAHHPSEIKAFLRMLKEQYPNKKKIIVFQAHLFSRTKDFLPEFKNAFSNADVVVVTPIFPAREENIYNISHHDIATGIQAGGTEAVVVENFEEATEKALSLSDSDAIIVSMGAGEQYKVIDQILSKMA